MTANPAGTTPDPTAQGTAGHPTEAADLAADDAARLTSGMPDHTEHLAEFVEAGILELEDLYVVSVIARNAPGTAPEVLLAAALCVRGLRHGHVCIELATVADTVLSERELAGGVETESETIGTVANWPETDRWAAALRDSDVVALCDPESSPPDSALVGGLLRPLVFDGERVYMERYWRYERKVGDALVNSAFTPDGPSELGEAHPHGILPGAEPGAVASALDHFMGTDDEHGSPNMQRRGAESVFVRPMTVLAGGPGTGKTYTVAHLLAAVQQIAQSSGEQPPEIALAAPTGKAAARMTDAVRAAVHEAAPAESVGNPLLALEATTIHRLLGYRDGISFRHDSDNPLPYDLVIIDETSMVALPLMARLLDALRADATIVLVGDPYQLASVEAGAVLGDMVGAASRPALGRSDTPEGPLGDAIVVLERVHRYGDESGIAELAEAVRTGDADRAIAVLHDGSLDDVRRVDPTDDAALNRLRTEVTAEAAEVMRLARNDDASAALLRANRLKVLCATRFGPLGSYAWREVIERRIPLLDGSLQTRGRWYIGRPVIITRNDYITGVFNGDTALVVDDDGRPMVALAGTEQPRLLSPAQLDSLDTWWSMTIHKSQGSEFAHAVVSLPDASSRILTNELLYTGITRGRERVTVVASEESVRTAVKRRISRASGLGARLWS